MECRIENELKLNYGILKRLLKFHYSYVNIKKFFYYKTLLEISNRK